MPDLDLDFELPPLPKRPVKEGGAEAAPQEVESAPAPSKDIVLEPVQDKHEDAVDELSDDDYMDFELPPLPAKKKEDAVEKVSEVSTDSLPETVHKGNDDKLDTISEPADNDLPDISRPVKTEEKIDIDDSDKPSIEDKMKEAEEQFDFSDDYDFDAITAEGVKLDSVDASILTDLTSSADTKKKNMRERIKLDDLAMEVGTGTVLGELSDEYKPVKEKAEDLLALDKLADDQKQVLKKRLQEDLQKRPENYNARASKHMYNRLMDEKKAKTAKAGFVVSLAPIALGFISAAISYLKLGWGNYEMWFQINAVTMLIGAMLLFIKSKHMKILSEILYIAGIIVYLGPGIVMYMIDDGTLDDTEFVIKTILFGIAAVINIIALVILKKSEPLNLYYTYKPSEDTGSRRRRR